MSHLQGTDYVGSMVVLEDGLAKRSDYRRFKVKTVRGNDDYAAMEEVLTRRLAALKAAEKLPVGERPKRFAYRPEPLARRRRQGPARTWPSAWCASSGSRTRSSWPRLAKQFEEVYRPGSPDPVRLRRGSDALYLLQRVRDEAHRFAITFHRERRGKRMTKSILDDIPGLGPARKARLIKEFGGVNAVRAASLEELLSRSWLPDDVGLRRVRGRAQGWGAMSEFAVVTGMSGAGRSTAAAALEDVGWFVIDNLPAGLIMKMVEMVDRPGLGHRAGGAGHRAGRARHRAGVLRRPADVLDELRGTRKRVRIVFLDAPDDVLVRRYEGTRRRHPLPARGVEASIARERELLEPVRARADLLVDTDRAELEPAPRPHPRGLRVRGRAAHADLGRLVRLQARPPARRRHRVRLPLPAQPVLDRGAAALQRARRAGPGLGARASPSRRPSWRSSTTCSRASSRRSSARGSRT